MPGSCYKRLVLDALAEDAPFGDPFGEAMTGEGKGIFFARGNGVFCGGPVAAEVFRSVDSSVVVNFVPEGYWATAGDQLGEASGPLSALLTAERTALNFLQRMSGIATLTFRFVEKVAPYGARILDTRKMTPLQRNLEKYAVRVGGGVNHRFSLSDGILIKENGIRAAGGIALAITAAKRAAHHLVKIEIEVETMAEAEEAVTAGADAILLDNMKPELVREVVERFGGTVFLEASGGIHLGNVEEYARTGVQAISVGAITHSASAFDISFELCL
ncbi:MAG: carboxylating nicotinate-nucleotide diphosphorylase [Syntrophorhabdaceae bacterium]|nr:carboxylating nicotinate-nucleotide diphosphorylase [Syntrophorhabdaceae bacterium]